MKPLLKPRRRAKALFDSLSAVLDCMDVGDAETIRRVEQVMHDFRARFEPLLGPISLELNDEIGQDTKFNWYLVKGSKRKWIGSFDPAPRPDQGGTQRAISLQISRKAIEERWDIVAEFLDNTYAIVRPKTMYVYDCDDWHVQSEYNIEGLEWHGVALGQVDTFVDFDGIETVDTRANPGYMTWWRGYRCSVQWLNYWSKEAIAAIFKEFPTKPIKGVDLDFLPDGGTRLRLGERPGKYNDVKFHELQLKVREWLGWHPSMWKLHPDDSDYAR